jgi:hypothetical protein
MKLVGGHGSWSLLFMMKVLVWNFMSDTHEVMTTFILIVLVSVSLYLTVQLYSKCCCGVLSAISVMWFFCIVLIINQSCSFPKTNWVYVLPLFAKCMQLQDLVPLLGLAVSQFPVFVWATATGLISEDDIAGRFSDITTHAQSICMCWRECICISKPFKGLDSHQQPTEEEVWFWS